MNTVDPKPNSVYHENVYKWSNEDKDDFHKLFWNIQLMEITGTRITQNSDGTTPLTGSDAEDVCVNESVNNLDSYSIPPDYVSNDEAKTSNQKALKGKTPL